MEKQKIVFKNKELDLRLSGILYLPDQFDLNKDYPAIVVTGPMLSVKEQAQSIYAKKLTEEGYVTLVFDGSYFGESQGQPRQQELPDVKPNQPTICRPKQNRGPRNMWLRIIHVSSRS